ncbi:ferrochelatase [Candidatus Odyssella acanthamoebae]|uniref:Ferrochelatase n=1 Tax=Candidatus Odyssella acanthamoebae TaxID=91604 RepID=A0A077AZF1_9PROT|nr:ferrochelatase [Candidatus Paracaedibacter acanthamoebae]AIK97058.1 ferrochelatase [Candidatus Paracaedibacter acanthamoebae]
MTQKKLAVVLMNLGGPDHLDSVRPFLYNLFSDPAIISLPSPFRQILARLIAARRTPKAQDIYKRLGGKSPLLENTECQKQALEACLQVVLPGWTSKAFIAMRHWHPFTEETVAAVKAWGADLVVTLPLYPQYSTTTTASSLKRWRDLAGNLKNLDQVCYFQEPGFIQAYQELIQRTLDQSPQNIPLRLLFSAHGIPQKLVEQGDPYQWQIEQSVAAIMQAFKVDHRICYQSRVGPLRWLGPSLEDELNKTAIDQVGVIVVPIAFVSDHSETLVELDMDFKAKALALNIPHYGRVPTVGDHPAFIRGLARLVAERVAAQQSSQAGSCPAQFIKCGCRS